MASCDGVLASPHSQQAPLWNRSGGRLTMCGTCRGAPAPTSHRPELPTVGPEPYCPATNQRPSPRLYIQSLIKIVLLPDAAPVGAGAHHSHPPWASVRPWGQGFLGGQSGKGRACGQTRGRGRQTLTWPRPAEANR